MNISPVIPDHTLLRPIGRGAYGEVWLARNVMGTLRAVKIVWQRQFESQRPYEREFAGIQRYEPVSHSSGGLVHLLHVGRNDAEGYFYYVMELADSSTATHITQRTSIDAPAQGNTLNADGYEPRTLRSDLRSRGRLPTADCIRVALDVTEGLEHLHRHGLVHRDVKPGNIIYVHGRAKLADIGLVSADGEGRTFVGTEGYIPPEGPGSPAADIYALGIVLYEASTGNSLEKFPDVPPEWFISPQGNDALEFHEVVLKACEGQRERRYPTAQSMQADLALLQSGQSVRRVRALERRYARLRISGIVAAILLVCALVAVLFANYRARLAAESRTKEMRLREQAQLSLARAESAEREGRQQLYNALLEQGRATVRSLELGQRVKALEAVRRAAVISNSVALRGVALSALALPDLRLERELPLPPDNTLVEFDPAFERYATCQGSGPVEIRAVSDRRALAALPASTNLVAYGARWSRDAKFLAVRRDYTTIQRGDWEVWEPASAHRLLLFHDVPGVSLAFHSRTNQITVATRKRIETWNVEHEQLLRKLELPHEPVQLVLSANGARFAVIEYLNPAWKVVIYNATDGVALATRTFTDTPGTLCWHPDGTCLAIPDLSGSVSLMDAQSGEIRVLGHHKTQAVFNVFTTNGDYLLSGGWERELICWDARTMQRAFTIGLNSFVAQFSADGRRCAVMTRTPSVQLCAFERPVLHHEFSEDLGARLNQAAFSPDGRWVAAAASERLAVWDLQSLGRGVIAANAGGTRMEFAANAELFANRRGVCFRWQVSHGTNSTSPLELKALNLAAPTNLVSLCLHSNQVLLTGSRGSMLLDPDRAEHQDADWKPTVDGLNGISPDGRWLAMFRSYTSDLYVYRMPDLALAITLSHNSNIQMFHFSPLSDELAVACRKSVTFWNTATWQRTRVATNFDNVLYSADGRTFWLSSNFRASGLYDARTLSPLLPLPVGTLPLATSPDGRYLAASVDARHLQLWDLAEVRRQLAKLQLDWSE